ncbi:hypothetical protein L6R53_27315 [Myxococcota bacterium]|nr:hypothetical protein [Myxococcota bacterium]
MLGGLLWLAVGCGPAAEPTVADGAPAALDAGWISQVVTAPASFTALVDRTGREGWVLLHQGRLTQAARAFPDGPGRARIALEQAWLSQDLAWLAAEAWPRLADAWVARDPAIAQGPLPALAAASLLATGAPVDLSALPADDQAWLAAIPAATAGQAPPADLRGPDVDGCVAAAIAMLGGSADDLPPACAADAPLRLDTAGSFYDPLRFAARAAAAGRQAQRGSGSDGDSDPLALLLFGPWWAPADLDAARQDPAGLGAAPAMDGPTLRALALPEAGAEDLPQAARERVRALDRALDDWERAQAQAADPDGAALLTDLALVPQARGRVLLSWARQALAQDRPHQATAYLMLAHDVEQARELGPRNPPSLFALAALAALRTGRTREALDHLDPLLAEHPEVRALAETIGDLAVLEGMDRQGDSKEN